MRKKFVLIVILCFTSAITLLAQTTKPDSAKTTTTPTKPVDKKALEKAQKALADKNRKDSLLVLKTAKLAADKIKKDSVASAKAQKNLVKKDTATAKKTAASIPTKINKDTTTVKKVVTTPVVKPVAVTAAKDTTKSSSAKAKPVVTTPEVKNSKTASKPVTPIVVKKDSTMAKFPDTKNPQAVVKPISATKDTAKAAIKTDKAVATPSKTIPAAIPLVAGAKDTSKNSIQNGKKPLVLSDKKTLALQKDSIAAAKAALKKQQKEAAKIIPAKTKADSAIMLRDSLKMDGLVKNLSNPLLTKKDKQKVQDSIAAMIKVKSKERGYKKGKSAKEYAKEAAKADPENFSEKDVANMRFGISVDSASRDSVRHIDIPFTNARPLPLSTPEPINIKFFHRYWRDIELSDPKNKKFATYHATLITSLLASIKSKEIVAYSAVALPPANPTGDAFTMPIAYDEMMAGLSDTSVVNELDKDGNIIGSKSVPNPFTPEKIAGYRIKEDVYYDKVRGRYITRIIGVAPLIKLTLSSGEVLNVQPLCWIKYKDLRKILVTIDIDPTKKVGDSMDDVFLQRRFYARIVQESNPLALRIKDYKTDPNDQLTEANRMEKKVSVFKGGSWNYMMYNKAGVLEVADDRKMIPKRSNKPIKGIPEPTDPRQMQRPLDVKATPKVVKQKNTKSAVQKSNAKAPTQTPGAKPVADQKPSVTPASTPVVLNPGTSPAADPKPTVPVTDQKSSATPATTPPVQKPGTTSPAIDPKPTVPVTDQKPAVTTPTDQKTTPPAGDQKPAITPSVAIPTTGKKSKTSAKDKKAAVTPATQPPSTKPTDQKPDTTRANQKPVTPPVKP